MTLYKHLCNTSSTTEVAINLEWWVSIKEITESATLLLYLSVWHELIIGQFELFAD